VSGLDICDGNAKIIHAILTQVILLILAVDCVVNDSVCLCTQLMRYHTLKILSEVSDGFELTGVVYSVVSVHRRCYW
jgi:hypothetical protein